ncbi:hypothetical protein [Oricola indica]|jgi:hypothetical protein|uniref:hypothetical protein n=1 Tax=Oricola indica TaxID=2872591 RepID=UPI001CBEEB72|nr:hypothetical protein [Oricola indica]
MLDLILAWGELDSALGMLVSCALGLSMADGAEKVGSYPASAKFRELYKVLRDAPNGAEAARAVKRHKKNYELYSKVRKPIAHSKCVGVKSTDRDYVLFAVFEKTGENELAVDAVPIQQLELATQWGREMAEVAMRIVDRINPFE